MIALKFKFIDNLDIILILIKELHLIAYFSTKTTHTSGA
jgi:hypothetical protein